MQHIESDLNWISEIGILLISAGACILWLGFFGLFPMFSFLNFYVAFNFATAFTLGFLVFLGIDCILV